MTEMTKEEIDHRVNITTNEALVEKTFNYVAKQIGDDHFKLSLARGDDTPYVWAIEMWDIHVEGDALANVVRKVKAILELNVTCPGCKSIEERHKPNCPKRVLALDTETTKPDSTPMMTMACPVCGGEKSVKGVLGWAPCTNCGAKGYVEIDEPRDA